MAGRWVTSLRHEQRALASYHVDAAFFLRRTAERQGYVWILPPRKGGLPWLPVHLPRWLRISRELPHRRVASAPSFDAFTPPLIQQKRLCCCRKTSGLTITHLTNVERPSTRCQCTPPSVVSHKGVDAEAAVAHPSAGLKKSMAVQCVRGLWIAT